MMENGVLIARTEAFMAVPLPWRKWLLQHYGEVPWLSGISWGTEAVPQGHDADQPEGPDRARRQENLRRDVVPDGWRKIVHPECAQAWSKGVRLSWKLRARKLWNIAFEPTGNFLESFKAGPLGDEITNPALALRRAHRIKLPDAVNRAMAQTSARRLVRRKIRDFPADDPGLREALRALASR